MTGTLTAGATWALLGCLWILVGVAVAGMLARQGHPPTTALAAIPCWPLLATLLGEQEGGGAVSAALDRLERALADHGEPVDVEPLRRALLDAEARIRRLDRVLAEERGSAPAEAIAELVAARARTASEIEAVVAEVARLRIRIGLRALGPDALEHAPLSARVADLASRVRALDEVAAMIPPVR